MKGNLLLLLMLLVSFACFAQPIIQPSWAPNVGDQWKIDLTDMTPDEPSEFGANVVWDYASLKSIGTFVTFDFTDPSTTPYVDSFPSSTIVAENSIFGNTAYGYYANTGTSFEYLGSASNAAGFTSYTILDDPQEFRYINLNYGSNAEDYYTQRTVSQFLTLFSYGYTNYDYVGYGTLKISTKTIDEVALIYQVDVVSDTINLPFSSTVNVDSTITYAWIAEGSLFPVCQWQKENNYAITIVDDNITEQELIDESTIFVFNPDYGDSSTKDLTTNRSLNVFPTLANDQLTIATDSDLPLDIFAVDGKKVMSLPVIRGQETIDVSEFAKGRFFVRQGQQQAGFVKM